MAGEIEVLSESLPQCQFVHHESHMALPGVEPGSPRWETGMNRLSYAAACVTITAIFTITDVWSAKTRHVGVYLCNV